ncbi:MAG: hypothetical protein ACRDH5_01520 [bacterium]
MLERWNAEYRHAGHLSERYAELGDRARTALAEAGVPVLLLQEEAQLRDAREPLFYDLVHLNERGQIVLADVIERELRALLHPR